MQEKTLLGKYISKGTNAERETERRRERRERQREKKRERRKEISKGGTWVTIVLPQHQKRR